MNAFAELLLALAERGSMHDGGNIFFSMLQKYLPLDLRPKYTRAIRRRLTKHEVRGERPHIRAEVSKHDNDMLPAQECHTDSSPCFCRARAEACQDGEAGEEGARVPAAEVCREGLSCAALRSWSMGHVAVAWWGSLAACRPPM